LQQKYAERRKEKNTLNQAIWGKKLRKKAFVRDFGKGKKSPAGGDGMLSMGIFPGLSVQGKMQTGG